MGETQVSLRYDRNFMNILGAYGNSISFVNILLRFWYMFIYIFFFCDFKEMPLRCTSAAACMFFPRVFPRACTALNCVFCFSQGLHSTELCFCFSQGLHSIELCFIFPGLVQH